MDAVILFNRLEEFARNRILIITQQCGCCSWTSFIDEFAYSPFCWNEVSEEY